MMVGAELLLFFLCSFLFDDGSENLGAGYKYYSDNNAIFGPNLDIPPYITRYGKDNNFIIIEQSPHGRNTAPIFNKVKYNYTLGLDATYYWIIDKRTKIFYGPIGYESFIAKCDSLCINIVLSETSIILRK